MTEGAEPIKENRYNLKTKDGKWMEVSKEEFITAILNANSASAAAVVYES